MLNNIDSYVGKKLKEKRKQFGLTQTDLSKQVGISFQQIQKYETGQNRISASMLFKMSNILEVSLEYFFPKTPELLIENPAIELSKE
jgi:transcriptional regulator with XRE-family HTH domain